MAGMRRAFIWATFARYLNLVINFGGTLVVARLIPPASYGIVVMCASVLSLAEALREFGGGAYLIQQRELTMDKIRTSVTVNALVTCVAAGGIFELSGQVSQFYRAPEVDAFLHVSIFGYLCGSLIYPVLALFNREFQFERIAIVSTAMSATAFVVTVTLAVCNFDYMSFAWGNVAGAVVGIVACFWLNAYKGMYRPSVSDWRNVVAFGAFDCLTSLAASFAEHGPYLVIGRFLPTAQVGIAQRAVGLALLPERVLLAGLGAVALPAFSRRSHDKGELRRAYMQALEYATAVYWPALVGLALLAQPIVQLVLGPKWHEVSTIVPIVCAAFCFAFPAPLQYPTLVASGRVRALPGLVFLQGAITVITVALTARFGLFFVAVGLLFSIPVNVAVGLYAVWRAIGVEWLPLLAKLRRSLVVTLCAACGPVAVMAATGWTSGLSTVQTFIAIALSVVFWTSAIAVTGHPVAKELRRLGDYFFKRKKR